MQGSAVLRGSNNVGLDDFKSLVYVLWEKEDQIPVIESTILKMVNPYDDRFKELKNNFSETSSRLNQTSKRLPILLKSLRRQSKVRV